MLVRWHLFYLFFRAAKKRGQGFWVLGFVLKNFRLRILGSVWGFGFGIWDGRSGFQVLGFIVNVFGFGVWSTGFGVSISGFRVERLGFRVKGRGFRVHG